MHQFFFYIIIMSQVFRSPIPKASPPSITPYPHIKHHRASHSDPIPNSLRFNDETLINIPNLEYKPRTIQDTITYSQLLFEKNGILGIVEEFFNHCFPEPSSNNKKRNHQMAKFLIYKTINPPVYPSNFTRNGQDLTDHIDIEVLPYYLQGFFSYAKKILTNKAFEGIIKENDKISRIVTDLVIKFINEYVYVNTERRGLVDYKGKQITGHQEFVLNSNTIGSLLLENLYAYKKNKHICVVNHLPQNGDILMFVGGNDVLLVEMKKSLDGLYNGFLKVKNSSVKSKRTDRTIGLSELGTFRLKKTKGVYLLRGKFLDNRILQLFFQEIDRKHQIRPNGELNKNFFDKKEPLKDEISVDELSIIYTLFLTALEEIEIVRFSDITAFVFSIVEETIDLYTKHEVKHLENFIPQKRQRNNQRESTPQEYREERGRQPRHEQQRYEPRQGYSRPGSASEYYRSFRDYGRR